MKAVVRTDGEEVLCSAKAWTGAAAIMQGENPSTGGLILATCRGRVQYQHIPCPKQLCHIIFYRLPYLHSLSFSSLLVLYHVGLHLGEISRPLSPSASPSTTLSFPGLMGHLLQVNQPIVAQAPSNFGSKTIVLSHTETSWNWTEGKVLDSPALVDRLWLSLDAKSKK